MHHQQEYKFPIQPLIRRLFFIVILIIMPYHQAPTTSDINLGLNAGYLSFFNKEVTTSNLPLEK